MGQGMRPAMKKPRGLLYVGHLPKELDEVYLRKYFEQFGVVNCVHMPKSAKTGNYKGYGFVEFASVETAKIAAGAMDKYIIDGRILHVEYRETTRRLRGSGGDKVSRRDRRKAYAEACMRS
ncbi:NOP15, nucleolar protein 15 [Babesia microti strain RI]|uniref:NOP15, nucleolar protein 15 n=1 Tax=Babesia microti (strain RI) TaxID=1133968 RepID=A0A1N6LW00_BABMR|nr:NOP15, nucleolar protein 15 [Babesia microti strain RI]SIO73123.1 NOP15, nucleolar protein 15 [Babesia microti strain RI]|eukprot:XP_021337235.1 NOP15, nucleolar protein 15 [Babesia microti strain RI]